MGFGRLVDVAADDDDDERNQSRHTVCLMFNRTLTQSDTSYRAQRLADWHNNKCFLRPITFVWLLFPTCHMPHLYKLHFLKIFVTFNIISETVNGEFRVKAAIHISTLYSHRRTQYFVCYTVIPQQKYFFRVLNIEWAKNTEPFSKIYDSCMTKRK